MSLERIDLCSGYFCPAGTAGVADITTQSGTPSVENLCPRGHFCPEGTPSDTEYPCPVGKYNQLLGQSDEATACRDCPIGRYCLQGNLQYSYCSKPLKIVSSFQGLGVQSGPSTPPHFKRIRAAPNQ